MENRSLLPQFNGDRGLAPVDSHWDSFTKFYIGVTVVRDLLGIYINGLALSNHKKLLTISLLLWQG